MKLSNEQERELKLACLDEQPREACGIISAGRVFRLTNHSPNEREFCIRSSDLEALASEYGLRELDAVWHTHPTGDPYPSDLDLASHPWPATLIIATRETVSYYGRPAETEVDV